MEDKKQVLMMVQRQRKLLYRLGTRKLHYLIKDELESRCLKCGRDKLFRYLREEDLMIKPKRHYTQTTNSKHWLRKYPNLIKDIKVKYKEQLWVSDITYNNTALCNLKS